MYAIIGIGNRFPGGNNTPEDLFLALKNKRDCVEDIPENRWNKKAFFHPDKGVSGTIITQRGGFIKPFYEFDNECFQMSMKESKSFDPIHKICLEVCLETLEDANVEYMGTNTGVFIGYGSQGFAKYTTSQPEYVTEYSATGSVLCMASNLLSYKFDLRGPSLTVDTACSSSGYALYTAINSLEAGDIEMALVGGASNLLNHAMTMCFSRLGVLSKDGMCKSFDANADGYVRSEGVGMILLKPLQRAIKDGNYVYGVIRGVCANEDGSLEPSITKPSPISQRILMKRCMEKAKVAQKDVFYVEAHATGTAIGDPAECKSIGQACGGERVGAEVLRLGSVKRNLGHLEVGSFIASMLKCCIMFDKKQLLPTPVNEVHPKLKPLFKKYNMKVQDEVEPFEPHGKIFLINSFGFGGANSCCVIEGFSNEIQVNSKSKTDVPYLFLLSARTEKALKARIKQYKDFSSTSKSLNQHQLAYTLNTKVRNGDRFLCFGVGKSAHESRFSPSYLRISDEPKKLCFVLSGQGPQNVGMGRNLFKSFPVFREWILKCDEIYKKLSGKSLVYDIGMFGEKECDVKTLNDIENTLPSLMFLQIALYHLYVSFGVKPDIVFGHSFGEMATLYVNGSITIEKAIQIAYARGKVCKTLDKAGKMMAVGIGSQKILEITKENKIVQLWICADNSPVSCTVGGAHSSVDLLDKILQKEKIFHKQLSITNAFHTPLLNPLKEGAWKLYENNHLDLSESNDPKILTYSSVTKEIMTGKPTTEYLWRNISEGVQFRPTIEGILDRCGGETGVVFLEIAAHPVLSLYMKQCGAKNVVSGMKMKASEKQTILQSVAHLTSHGYQMKWEAIMGRAQRLRHLPRYPFQRKYCFTNIPSELNKRIMSEIPKPLLGKQHNSTRRTWNNRINTKNIKWLSEHVFQKTVIYPAVGYIEQFIEAGGNFLQKVSILKPLVVPTNDNLMVTETCISDDDVGISISSKLDEDTKWVLNSTAQLTRGYSKSKYTPPNVRELISKFTKTRYTKEEMYEKAEIIGLSYGPHFQLLESLYISKDSESIGIINAELLNDIPLLSSYNIHPAIMDNMVQAILISKEGLKGYLPTSFESISIYPVSITPKLYVHSIVIENSRARVKGNAYLMNDRNELIMEMIGCVLTATREASENKPRKMLTSVWQTKKMPELDYDGIKSMVSTDQIQWMEYSERLPILKSYLMNHIAPVLKKLKFLGVAENRHSYLNWINKVHEEQNVDGGNKEEVKLDFIDAEVDETLATELAANFYPILRNKTKLKDVKEGMPELIGSFFESCSNVKQSLTLLNGMFTQISQLKTRVIRILDLCKDTRSLLKHILPILKNFAGRIEVFYSSEYMKDELKKFNFATFKQFDTQKSFTQQGLSKNSIDIALGVDVDLSPASLKNLASIMIENGILFFVQSKNKYRFVMNFIFGTMVDFWDCPADTSDSIANVEGFEKFLFQNGFYSSCTVDCNAVYVLIANKLNLEEDDNLEDEQSDLNSKVEIFKSPNTLELLKICKKRMAKQKAGEELKPLLVVTRGATDTKDIDLTYTGNIGFMRVYANENPLQVVKMIDLPKNISKEDENEILERVSSNFDDYEYEISYRGDNVYVPRLIEMIPNEDGGISSSKTFGNPIGTKYRLAVEQPGVVKSLYFHDFEIPELSEDDVLVRVCAASLNFKDLMLAMNMLGDFELKFGLEFSGVIEKCGNGVKKFQVGDEVFGFGDNSLSSHVKTTKNLIVKKPKNFSHVEACSIPTVFVTPYFALVKKVMLQEGMNVLIHSAAGGVGQAAIQLVNHFKCTPLATCGSQEKRDLLNKKYGVKVFGDSHTETWDIEIQNQLPEKDGVDVVLNSLAKDHIERGIKILKPFGSFIEIGKRDILNNSPMHLAPFLENLSYFSVHLDRMLDSRPAYVGVVLKEVAELLANNKIKPVVDVSFPTHEIVKAFKFMQSGKHRGKIVIDFQKDSIPKLAIKMNPSIFSGNKCYILSGGLGKLGFELCERMISKGARKIYLLSRSGNTTKHQKNRLKHFEENGLEIVVSITDISKRDAVNNLFELIESKSQILGGLIHMAMVLRDGPVDKQTEKMFKTSFAAKIEGAKNLMANINCPYEIDFIIFFSSISSVVGNIGQSNYSAANHYLDCYARKLTMAGFNAKSINLNVVVDIGVAADDLGVRKAIDRGTTMDIQSGMTLHEVLNTIEIMVMDKGNVQFVPWANFKKMVDNHKHAALKFSHLVNKNEEVSGSSGDKGVEITVEGITDVFANSLDLENKDINVEEKLTAYGMDSLLAVEISQLLQKKFQVNVTQMELLGGITIKQIAKNLEIW